MSMRLSVAQIAAAVQGKVVGHDAAVCVGVGTDSRAPLGGKLFVALRGARFDGHDYLEAAHTAGAVAALVDEVDAAPPGLSLIVVPDTRLALGTLARHWRMQFPGLKVAAITGSNGKTTVKEMLISIATAALGTSGFLATRGNLNNDIGLPLTLLNLEPEHQVAILEVGMNHPGELSYLSGLAVPDVALINNAQAAHLQGLKDVRGVALAKAELLDGLPVPQGIAVLNAEDEHVALWRERAGRRQRLEFGLEQGDVRADVALQTLGSALRLHLPGRDLEVSLQVPGQHNARNAVAAATLAVAMALPDAAIVAGLNAFTGVQGRLQQKRRPDGALLLDDTYNANPDSVAAALRVLAALPGSRLMILGDLGELGADWQERYQSLGQQGQALGLTGFWTLGQASHLASTAFGAGGQHFTELESLVAQVRAAGFANILVKGSRFMRMERVVAALMEENA